MQQCDEFQFQILPVETSLYFHDPKFYLIIVSSLDHIVDCAKPTVY